MSLWSVETPDFLGFQRFIRFFSIVMLQYPFIKVNKCVSSYIPEINYKDKFKGILGGNTQIHLLQNYLKSKFIFRGISLNAS